MRLSLSFRSWLRRRDVTPQRRHRWRPRAALAFTALLSFLTAPLAAQEVPYFITYGHHFEEPGSLEISLTPVLAAPKGGNRSLAPLLELEYGVKAWWTTEVYLDGQHTFGDSAVFTGYRWEHRFRPLMREYWLNPVVYVEFEDINGADKTLKEVVGFDSWHDLLVPNGEARSERKREIEAKLILSRDYAGWNFAGNVIAEKNLAHAPWEFGYALGASRPLGLAASPVDCQACRENLWLGVEVYGGLGEWRNLALRETAHYIAPTVAWTLPSGVTLRISPGIGLTASSNRTLLRFGISYEIPRFGRSSGTRRTLEAP